MIEHREPPAPGPSDAWAGPSGPGLPPVRRWARDRLALAAALACLAVGVIGALGWLATRSAVAWLHAQPDRLGRFADIELDPPPRPWMKSGPRWLLDRVEERYGGEPTLPVLDLDLGRLRDAFRVCPWVEEVTSIRRLYPNRLVVRLRYREPVAFIRLVATTVYLDKDAVVLPGDDVDPGQAPLIRLEFLEPLEALPGLPLRARLTLTGDTDAPLPTSQLLEAAHLAQFIKTRLTTTPPAPARIKVQHLAPLGPGRLCLYVGEGIWVNWGESPGAESAGMPTAAEKWAMLGDWIDRHGAEPLDPPESPQRWLYFTRSGVQIGQAR